MRKYVTVVSNAKNNPNLRLSLGCTIHAELEIEPKYLSLRPDKYGMVKETLTVLTSKKDLQVLEVSFMEQERFGNQEKTGWQTTLPILFTHALTKPDSSDAEGYLRYRLAISQALNYTTPVYGSFTVRTNHAKKQEVVVNGVILEVGSGGR
ncbi:MAG: hypothetical protein JXA18_05075 [Chitinispirillaceae bacterium]|nr:hypothetical protein [Chitinispirillaceae bacterium]